LPRIRARGVRQGGLRDGRAFWAGRKRGEVGRAERWVGCSRGSWQSGRGAWVVGRGRDAEDNPVRCGRHPGGLTRESRPTAGGQVGAGGDGLRRYWGPGSVARETTGVCVDPVCDGGCVAGGGRVVRTRERQHVRPIFCAESFFAWLVSDDGTCVSGTGGGGGCVGGQGGVGRNGRGGAGRACTVERVVRVGGECVDEAEGWARIMTVRRSARSGVVADGALPGGM